MFKPTYLYIKTHNKTGLKYFGKTTSADPSLYKGSGVYWLKHLKKHGNYVTTEILGYYLDEEKCRNDAITFSENNNIVESTEWANLKEERLDGGFDYINENRNFKEHNKKIANIRNYKDPVYLEKLSKSIKNSSRDFSNNVFKQNKDIQQLGNSPESRAKAKLKQKETLKNINFQQGDTNSQFGTMWIYSNELQLNKKIKKNDPIPEGWIRGRKIKF